MGEIYTPSEDSFFLRDFLKKELNMNNINCLRFLDLGSGSCIIAETVKEIGIKDITCVDINKEAVKLALEKGFKAIKSNLFENLNNEKYDIICFNAPYLPIDKREPKKSRIITTGGKKGDEISVRFIKEAKKHLNKSGKIYLLISSLTPLEEINKFKPKIVAKKKIFFEELIILKLTF